MCNIFKNSTPLLIFILLELCTSTSGNSTILDLDVICGVVDNTNLLSLPPQCTALAVSAKNLNLQLGMIDEMKGTLPLLIIMNDLYFSSISEIDIDGVFKEFFKIDFDFMVFGESEFEYGKINDSSRTRYNQDLGDFLDKIKTCFPGKGFGLKIGHDVKSVEKKMDLKLLNEHSDFFLFETIDYRECTRHRYQADMQVLATKVDILGSFEEIKDAGLLLDKIIYTIDLKIDSRKYEYGESMGYSYARLRISEGALGIHIKYIEYDDVDGSCGCKTKSDQESAFRGVKTIAGASQEDVNDLSYYDCIEGAYPVIRGPH